MRGIKQIYNCVTHCRANLLGLGFTFVLLLYSFQSHGGGSCCISLYDICTKLVFLGFYKLFVLDTIYSAPILAMCYSE